MREWKRCYNGSWNSTLTMWNVHLLAGNIKCERMFFRNLPMISTCFSNICLLSPLLLGRDCCLPLLSGVPLLPAQPRGSVFFSSNSPHAAKASQTSQSSYQAHPFQPSGPVSCLPHPSLCSSSQNLSFAFCDAVVQPFICPSATFCWKIFL